MTNLICEAIHSRKLLEFDYEGMLRVAAPYCHGVTNQGLEVVRAVQVAGASRSGRLGIGKLWLVEKMKDLRTTGDLFEPDDPHYNPNDSAMPQIHCRI